MYANEFVEALKLLSTQLAEDAKIYVQITEYSGNYYKCTRLASLSNVQSSDISVFDGDIIIIIDREED